MDKSDGDGRRSIDGWLYQVLQDMRTESTDQHMRLRSDMTAGFDRIRDEVAGNREHVSHVERRVLTMEVQRDDERRDVTKRQWAIGVVAPLLLWLLSRAFDVFSALHRKAS